MGTAIQALTELQRIDDEIRGRQVQRDELAANLHRLKSILEQMGAELEEKREKLSEATRFYEEKQEELRDDGLRLSHAKQKLASVTRTKEYAAMQRELDNLRRKYNEDEQELKRLSSAIEEYKASISGGEGKLGELQAEVAREDASSADKLTQLDGEIGSVAKRKSAIAVQLDDDLKRRYERILSRRDGKAVVPAVDGKCTGCQMRLPPQTFILVQRGESLEACPTCQRYLFYEETDNA